MRQRRIVSAAAGVLMIAVACRIAVAGAPALTRVELRPVPQVPQRRPLLAADGRQVGECERTRGATRVHVPGRPVFETPAFQEFMASADGRTIAAYGDPDAYEHSDQMRVQVYSDGRKVRDISGRFDSESSLTVAADGTIAIVGHAIGDRPAWEAVLLAPEGDETFSHKLPAGMQARDPVVFDGFMLARLHGLRNDGTDGQVVRIDRQGVRKIRDAAGALQLVGFANADRALIRERDAVTLVDSATGRKIWRLEATIRPAGRHAWAWWAHADAIAVLTTDVQRRGGATPPVVLRIMDAGIGAVQDTITLERREPVAATRLVAERARLEVHHPGVVETFRTEGPRDE